MVDETRATTRKQGDGWQQDARLSAEDAIHGQQQPANFAVDLMHNDITLGLDEFGEHPMFLGQVVRQIYNTAREGLGDKYSTSVYRHSSHWPGGWNSHAVPGASVTPS